jgi:hypothetical protein
MTKVNNREDICIVQKETFEWIIDIIDDADGTDVDLTSVNAITLQAKKFAEDDVVVLELDLGSGIEVSDALVGEITITISSADTEVLTFKKLYYDLFYSLDGVVFKKYKQGIIRLERSVTV